MSGAGRLSGVILHEAGTNDDAPVGPHYLIVRRYAVIAAVEIVTWGRIQPKTVEGLKVRWLAEHTRQEIIGL